ncbi:MAG: magnesium transporter CorA family protein [Candidatus Colwellbacteria bacterium]|nr:magnesium transporter CorA family protein [Candidatus Colwellbacteria bacterium]
MNKIDQLRPGSWVLVEEPTTEELRELAESMSLDEGLLRDGIDPYEVPRMETDSGNIYVYARTPHQEGEMMTTAPLLVVLGSDFVMTVSGHRSPILRKMLGPEENLHTTQKVAMLIRVFSEVVSSYNIFLTDMRKRVRGVSSNLEDITNRDIMQLVMFENIMNDFLSALIPMNSIISNLLSGKFFKMYEQDHEIIEDLFLGIGQLIEIAKSTLKTTVNIREAYSVIMTTNLNKVIKMLTALTIVLTIPTMISSFFGMNVMVPLSQSPYGFSIVVIITVAIAGGLIFIFNRNNWL